LSKAFAPSAALQQEEEEEKVEVEKELEEQAVARPRS
jgi:hypothetical protein